MNFNLSYLKSSLAVCLISMSVSSMAQINKEEPKKEEPKKETEKASITEEIEVVRPYKPILAEAVKIRRSPDLNDNKLFKPVLTYTILDKKLELNSNIKELQAQKLAAEERAALLNNYIKIGAGNLNTGLAEVYLNTGQDEALQLSIEICAFLKTSSITFLQTSSCSCTNCS